jgi:thiol:disulfide interchange protein
MLDIIYGIENLEAFKQLLETNPGLLFIKFTADWCVPCKKIKEHTDAWFARLPDNTQVVIVDIDESFEVYAFLKNKKMVAGIPAILMYYQGNLNYPFDESVSSSDKNMVDKFFNKCLGIAVNDGVTFPLYLRK